MLSLDFNSQISTPVITSDDIERLIGSIDRQV